jgi:hypothetical protein
MAVLGLFRLFKELRLSQVIPDIVIPFMFRSSNWSSYIWLPFIYFLYNAGFRLSIYVSVPAQSLSFIVVYYLITGTIFWGGGGKLLNTKCKMSVSIVSTNSLKHF